MPVLDMNDAAAVERFTTFVRNSKFGQVTQDLVAARRTRSRPAASLRSCTFYLDDADWAWKKV